VSIKKSKPNQSLPHPQTGLTLIELLIVIAIIAILIIIGWMTWRNQFNKAKDATRKDDLQRLSISLEEYFNDNDCYPIAGITDNCGGPELQPYLQSIPCDPVTNTKYCYIPDTDPCPKYYRLLSSLDYTDDPIIAKLQCYGNDYCGYEPECATAEQEGYNYGVSSLNIPVLNPEVSPPPASPPPGSPDPSPPPEEDDYACDPKGECNHYADPEGSGCPRTFADPTTCQEYCEISSIYWCER
jgi:general secretion pathway protein G